MYCKKYRYLSIPLKIRLFNCHVVSILLYDAMTWTMIKTLASAATGSFAMPLTSIGTLLEFTSLPIRRSLRPITYSPSQLSFVGASPSPNTAIVALNRPRPQHGNDVLFFSLKGTRTRGNRNNYYRKLFSEETLLDDTSLQNAILDRDYWRTIIQI